MRPITCDVIESLEGRRPIFDASAEGGPSGHQSRDRISDQPGLYVTGLPRPSLGHRLATTLKLWRERNAARRISPQWMRAACAMQESRRRAAAYKIGQDRSGSLGPLRYGASSSFRHCRNTPRMLGTLSSASVNCLRARRGRSPGTAPHRRRVVVEKPLRALRVLSWRRGGRMTPPDLDRTNALFLDLDGTLLEIAPTPELVVVPPNLPGLLASLHALLGGAVAIVSGRSIGRHRQPARAILRHRGRRARRCASISDGTVEEMPKGSPFRTSGAKHCGRP